MSNQQLFSIVDKLPSHTQKKLNWEVWENNVILVCKSQKNFSLVQNYNLLWYQDNVKSINHFTLKIFYMCTSAACIVKEMCKINVGHLI